MEPRILEELLPPEIKKELIQIAAALAFKKGKEYPLLLRHFATKLFPHLLKKIQALEKGAPAFPAYLQAKRYLLEIKIWFNLNLEAWESFHRTSGEDKRQEVFSALGAQQVRIERFRDKALKMAIGQFPSQYQIPQIFEELDRILLNPKLKLERFSEKQREDFRRNLEGSKEWIRQIAALIQDHRHQWLERILDTGRSLSLSYPQQFPHSILYTSENRIYIVLETAEHFLGIGEGKIVTRILDLDNAAIKALVKPRTIFMQEAGPEEAQKKRKGAFESAYRESSFLMQLKGQEGILQVYERLIFELNGNKHLYLIEERYEDLSLQGHLYKELPIEVKIAIARHLLKGLIHIHEKKIIHRDLKPGNVLLDLSKNNAVIGDFNFACHFGERPYVTISAFTPVSCSPEYAKAVLTKKGEEVEKVTTPLVDVWSLGMIFYCLFFDVAPPISPKGTAEQILEQIVQMPKEWFPEFLMELPFAPLIKRMLSVDPHERPTAKEALIQFEQLLRS